MKAEGRTDIGITRETNQDNFRIAELSDGGVFAIVCDGMGGPGGGGEASEVAVSEIMRHVVENYEAPHRSERARECLAEAFEKANLAVREKAYDKEDLHPGMGTTAVAAIAYGDRVVIANCGDSRAYLVSDGALTQITRDHSMVQEMVDAGTITKAEGRHHPQKNIITRAIGAEPTVKCDLFTADLRKGDLILMCTDGLTNELEDAEIGFEMSIADGVSDMLMRLIDLANGRGGADNITVLILSMED